jgi:hypothetical protein
MEQQTRDEELRKGHRLGIYRIMVDTWHADPKERPELSDFFLALQFLASQLKDHGRETQASASKITQRLNATKDAMMNSTGNGDDYKSQNVTGGKSTKKQREDNYSSQNGKSVRRPWRGLFYCRWLCFCSQRAVSALDSEKDPQWHPNPPEEKSL